MRKVSVDRELEGLLCIVSTAGETQTEGFDGGSGHVLWEELVSPVSWQEFVNELSGRYSPKEFGLFQEADDFVDHDRNRPGADERDETEHSGFKPEAATGIGAQHFLCQTGEVRSTPG